MHTADSRPAKFFRQRSSSDSAKVKNQTRLNHGVTLPLSLDTHAPRLRSRAIAS